jgi:hypothetical protein
MCCFALVAAASLSAQTPVSAQQHLQNAQQSLAVAKNQSQLTQDFSALVASYGAGQPGDAWKSSFASVERDVVRLIGGGGPPLDTSHKTIRMLRTELLGSDESAPLAAFRTNLELFYDAATTGRPVLTN